MYVDIDSRVSKDYLLSIIRELLNSSVNVLEESEEENFFPVIIEDSEIFYHGTSKIIGDIIDQIGHICIRKITEIIPSFEEETELLEEIGYYTKGRIYLTTDIEKAKKWAEHRAELDKSTPVIYKIIGKDINDSKCKITVDALLFKSPIDSIVLKDCDCIKSIKSIAL